MRFASVALLVVATAGLGCHGSEEDVPTKTPFGTALLVPTGGTNLPTPVTPAPTPKPSTPPTTQPPSTQPPEPGGGAVAKLAVKVLFVVCNGEGIPDSENLTKIPVGCKIHLDLNAKDEDRNPTDPEETPEWNYSRRELVRIALEEDYYQIVEAQAPGEIKITVSADGITSNDLWLQFYR